MSVENIPAGVKSTSNGDILSDRLFQKRIEPIPSPSRPRDSEVETSTLTFEEENAIRYAAGCVSCCQEKDYQVLI